MREADGHRDFPGRGLLINVLRIVHIAGLAGISAVVLAGAGGARSWGAAMLVSGLMIARRKPAGAWLYGLALILTGANGRTVTLRRKI